MVGRISIVYFKKPSPLFKHPFPPLQAPLPPSSHTPPSHPSTPSRQHPRNPSLRFRDPDRPCPSVDNKQNSHADNQGTSQREAFLRGCHDRRGWGGVDVPAGKTKRELFDVTQIVQDSSELQDVAGYIVNDCGACLLPWSSACEGVIEVGLEVIN